jgi:hypothetical protein
MSAIVTTEAMRGIDCKVVLTAADAERCVDHGYEFVLRYIPRIDRHANDLTPEEARVIRAAGLGLIAVQHVESESCWRPSLPKGTQYGTTAATECVAMALAPGTSVFLDLEGVDLTVDDAATIGYCNNWYACVKAMGFTPGLYVGWRCGLTPDQLYRRLKFDSYWSAYNLNSDEFPSVRGVQMRQRVAKPSDIPAGIASSIVDDVDVVTGDALGGFPVMDRAVLA